MKHLLPLLMAIVSTNTLAWSNPFNPEPTSQEIKQQVYKNCVLGNRISKHSDHWGGYYYQYSGDPANTRWHGYQDVVSQCRNDPWSFIQAKEELTKE